MSDVNFIDVDPQQIISEMSALYESLSGKTLYPGQLESILIKTFAARETQLRVIANEAAKLNLLRFSKAPYIDEIGLRVGVNRLPSSAAVCTIRLVFTPGHGNLTVPAGIRIQPINGSVVFATDEEVFVDALTDEAFVSATCLSEGIIGNGIATNEVVVILDPQPYLLSANNTDATNGGANQESDDDLRERIRLAPSTFSTAGSDDAYIYWAKSASTLIGDVQITSLNPGDVNVYVLMKDGSLPNSTIISQVDDTLSAKKRRPINDHVIVAAPTQIDYEIDIEITLITGEVASEMQTRIENILNDYKNSKGSRMGLDIVVSKIKSICSIEGVYDVTVTAPANNILVGIGEVANCLSLNVSIGGYSDE